MSKTYLLLIGALVVLVLVVGGYAFYKSSSKPGSSLPTYTPPVTSSPTVPSSQTNQPTISPQKNQITLSVVAPKNGVQLSGPSVQVVGQTVPGADVSINDQDLKSDASGNFTTTVTLEEGDNYILVTAVNNSGQVAEQELTVTYTPTQ